MGLKIEASSRGHAHQSAHASREGGGWVGAVGGVGEGTRKTKRNKLVYGAKCKLKRNMVGGRFAVLL